MGRLIIDTKHLKISGSALLSFSSSHLSQQGRLSLTNLWNQQSRQPPQAGKRLFNPGKPFALNLAILPVVSWTSPGIPSWT